MLPAASGDLLTNVIHGQILPLLAPTLRTVLGKVSPSNLSTMEEIRLRQGKPVQIYTTAGDFYLNPAGYLVKGDAQAYRVTREELAQTLQLLTRSSLYALEEELRRGYLTVSGGHRVGLAGRVVLSPGGEIQTLKDIMYLNIRIARQIPGVADPIKQHLVNTAGYTLYNSLIISPPQCGKTTLLRDLARQISDGTLHTKLPGLKVGIVDERSELAGSVNGVPQHTVGERTDILDACPKAEGMLMLIRSMSPHVIITDEIGREEDRNAIMEAVHAGVTVVTSAHGYSLLDIQNRPALKTLFEAKVFSRYLVLSRRNGPVTLEAVHDRHGQILYQREGKAK